MRDTKGITLIALVITTVVLLILAGITIGSITGDNGIIKEARSSKESAEKVALEEQVEAAIIVAEQKYRNPTLAQVIEEILRIETIASVEDTTGTITSKSGYEIEGKLDAYIIKIPTIEESMNKFFEQKTEIEDDDKKKFVVPAGFKIAEDSAKIVADGVVIEDRNGNQFVWVPVEDIKKFITIEGYSSNGSRESYLTNCTEPFTSGYSTEISEYNAMRRSVENNHGFYIGRFETGEDSLGNIVVKQGYEVYRTLWGNSMSDISYGAVKLSREFASVNGYQGVTSTLCYGVQWDATMQFMDSNYITGDCAENSYVRNSTNKGQYETINGEPYKTGYRAEYVEKNIYDMAGNAWELTMEAYGSDRRVCRGGASRERYPVSSRGNNMEPNGISSNVGFRIALYL